MLKAIFIVECSESACVCWTWKCSLISCTDTADMQSQQVELASHKTDFRSSAG